MITKLFLENFRAFEKETIELSKINLFFGPNNAGKSALISAINLISQTVQSRDIASEVLLTGKFEDFGSYVDMVYLNDDSKKIKIGIEAELTIPIRALIESKRGGRLVRFREEIRRGYIEITLGYRKLRHEVIVLGTELRIPQDEVTIRTKRNRVGRHVTDHIEGFEDISNSEIDEILDVRNLLPYLYLLKVPSRGRSSFGRLRMSQLFVRALNAQLNKVEFVGPFRASPQRLYALTGESPLNVGKHGERALELLIQDEKRKGKEKKKLFEAVSQWMRSAEIAEEVLIVPVGDRYYAVDIKNYHTGEIEDLTDVGFGCSQIMPVIIAGFNIGPGGVFIVEEPEIHLHPKAQAELGSLFQVMYERGIQLIIETHSEHLLLRIQSYVAHGDIKAEDVNVYYIDPKGREGRKEIYRIPLGVDGYFTEKWPRGFFPERLKEAERLAGLSVDKKD